MAPEMLGLQHIYFTAELRTTVITVARAATTVKPSSSGRDGARRGEAVLTPGWKHVVKVDVVEQ
jgi:hypothetical protein